MLYVILLGIVAFAVLRAANRARRDDDDDGPGGPKRVRVRIHDRNHFTRGRK
jgi:hypothetical protein